MARTGFRISDIAIRETHRLGRVQVFRFPRRKSESGSKLAGAVQLLSTNRIATITTLEL